MSSGKNGPKEMRNQGIDDKVEEEDVTKNGGKNMCGKLKSGYRKL